jgi:hypothetical protein
MSVVDPKTLRAQPVSQAVRGLIEWARRLYTFTGGNEYLTLGAALQITTDPSGTPAANTLYKGNIAKAWVNLNGTGTIAIRDSFNVDSITDNDVGVYTVTLDQDMADANYSVVTGGNYLASSVSSSPRQGPGSYLYATGSFRLLTGSDSTTRSDWEIVTAALYGDQ